MPSLINHKQPSFILGQVILSWTLSIPVTLDTILQPPMFLRIHPSYLILHHLISSFVTQKWAKNLKKLASYMSIPEVFWELRWSLNWIVNTTCWNTKRDLILENLALFRGICLFLHLVVGGVWTTHYIKGALRSASYRSRILLHTEQSFFRSRQFLSSSRNSHSIHGPESLFLYSKSPVTSICHKL